VSAIDLTPCPLVVSEVGPLEDSRVTHDVALKLGHIVVVV